MKLDLRKPNGENAGQEEFLAGLSEKKYSLKTIHQAVKSYANNARIGRAHTKDRSERRGGGKKPWRQKGTGRARAGSSRSPIWRKGGVAFGPRTEKNYADYTSHSMRRAGLQAALLGKIEDKELVVLQEKPASKGKTKEMSAFLSGLSLAGSVLFLVAGTKEERAPYVRAGRNIARLRVMDPRIVTAGDMLNAANVITDSAGLRVLEERLIKKEK